MRTDMTPPNMVSAAMMMEYPDKVHESAARLEPKSFLMSGMARLVPVTAKGRAAMPSMEVVRPMTAKRGTAVLVVPPDIHTVWQIETRWLAAECLGFMARLSVRKIG